MERELLARATLAQLMARGVEFEYLYLNSWDGPEFLALFGRSLKPVEMFIEMPPNNERTSLAAYSSDPTLPPYSQQNKFRKTTVVGMAYAGQSLRQPPVEMKTLDGAPQFEDCYFFTADGEIYQLISAWMFSRVNHIELSELVDPIVRDMLSLVRAELSTKTN